MSAARDSAILYIMSFLVPLTFNLTLIALPLKALDNGLTRGTVALVVLVSNALQIPGRPIFGYIGDRIGTKIPIMMANILYALAYFAYYVSYDLTTILLSALIQGLAVSMFWSSVFSHNVRLAWADSAFSVGSMLSTSFMGSVVGAFFSGYLVEWFGYDQVFYYSSLIMLASFVLSVPLENIGGSSNVNYKVAFKITFKNVSETAKSINSIAVFPLIRTYGTVMMLNAGLTEGFVGLILTVNRVISVVAQYPAARFYNWILEKRYSINILALASYIAFALLTNRETIFLSISAFIIGTFLSSILPSGQLTKATTENLEYSTVGVGGFGAGLSILRFTYTGIGSTTGAFIEHNVTNIEPDRAAFVVPVLIFLIVSLIAKLKDEKTQKIVEKEILGSTK